VRFDVRIHEVAAVCGRLGADTLSRSVQKPNRCASVFFSVVCASSITPSCAWLCGSPCYPPRHSGVLCASSRLRTSDRRHPRPTDTSVPRTRSQRPKLSAQRRHTATKTSIPPKPQEDRTGLAPQPCPNNSHTRRCTFIPSGAALWNRRLHVSAAPQSAATGLRLCKNPFNVRYLACHAAGRRYSSIVSSQPLAPDSASAAF
jgi:hypothetical protein